MGKHILSRSLLSVCLSAALANFIPSGAIAQDLEGITTSWLRELSVPSLGEAYRYLPVPSEKVRLVLRLSDRRVYLYRDEEIEVSYPVAIGRAGWETPTGEFKVWQKIKNPSWEHPWSGEVVPPGPNNPLGLGWVGFWSDGVNAIGFHGTPNESLIGQAVSHGCVRMRNADIVALFDQVEVGTPVVVEP